MKTFKEVSESNLQSLNNSQQKALTELISENKPIFAKILLKYLPKGAKIFNSEVGIYFHGFAINMSRGPFDSGIQFFTEDACKNYINCIIETTKGGMLTDEYPEPKNSPISFSPYDVLEILSKNEVDIEKEMHDYRGVSLATKTGIV